MTSQKNWVCSDESCSGSNYWWRMECYKCGRKWQKGAQSDSRLRSKSARRRAASQLRQKQKEEAKAVNNAANAETVEQPKKKRKR